MEGFSKNGLNDPKDNEIQTAYTVVFVKSYILYERILCLYCFYYLYFRTVRVQMNQTTEKGTVTKL